MLKKRKRRLYVRGLQTDNRLVYRGECGKCGWISAWHHQFAVAESMAHTHWWINHGED